MFFFLTRELWQTVRHCTRQPDAQSSIWYWTPDDLGEDDLTLRSHEERRTMSSILARAAERARKPVLVVAASAELSAEFREIILRLADGPKNLRISVILTSLLSDEKIEELREFLQEHQHLHHRISTFFFATRLNSDMLPNEPAAVGERYRTFLRLLCVGKESLAHSLGLFRTPMSVERPEGLADPLEEEEFPANRAGILAVLGVQSWLPRKKEIVRLTEGLLSMYVLAEQRKAELANRTDVVDPDTLINGALYLGMTDAPLNSRHFAGMIPPPPDSPFETWKVPFSTKRARKQTHYLQRTVQQDFSEYTKALEATLDDICGRIRRQSAIAFSEAAKVYRSEMLKDADLGELSLLLRDYYPAFGAYEEALLADVEEEPTGWPPDESLDLFCGVYEALDDGLDKLPTRGVWTGAIYVALAFFLGAGILWDGGDGWLTPALALAGLLAPASLWIYRMLSVRRLRKRLVQISEDVFASLKNTFVSEIQWTLKQTRIELERNIRMDAMDTADRLRREFEAIPFLFTAPPEIEPEEIPREIREYREALIAIGIDEVKLDPLPNRLDGLAKRIIQVVQRDPSSDVNISPDAAPVRLVEEWLDELVGSSILPLEKVDALREEIVDVVTTWRWPALMGPLTDAELHRGFRKVVVLPDSDIAYQRLGDAFPRYSGNSVVSLKVWSGPAPGIAVCSAVTGLPDSILEYQGNGHHPARPLGERPIGERSVGLR